MELKEFIGKVVISKKTGKQYELFRITSPCIVVKERKQNAYGTYAHYQFDCVNGDPITDGALVFEDASLTEPFKTAYAAHCRSKAGYYEDIGYWSRKD